MNAAQHILVCLVRAYQFGLSPVVTGLFGPKAQCRFTPTCSHYAVEAVKVHGAVRGGALAVRRLCRCHPWGPLGPDPVPLANTGAPAPAATHVICHCAFHDARH